VTIAVDESAAVAGLLTPGDRVDLRWRGGAHAELGNVPVIATGRQYAAADGNATQGEFATITLELTAAEARQLAEADLGDLRVLLRNPADTGSTELPRTARPVARVSEGVTLIIGGQGGTMPGVQLLTAVGP
jgi:Flp pilus assembly protein CpaB